jgi:hypothetical protein
MAQDAQGRTGGMAVSAQPFKALRHDRTVWGTGRQTVHLRRITAADALDVAAVVWGAGRRSSRAGRRKDGDRGRQQGHGQAGL